MEALKFEVDSLDGVADPIKSLYEEREGRFRLRVEGIDPADELKEALRKERDLHKSAASKLSDMERERREASEAAERARLEAARKSGDMEALEKSWTEKLRAKDSILEQLTVGQTATMLATDLAVKGSADVLLPHIKSRLKTEFIEGNPRVTVLDRDGRPSAMTVEELKTEFASNPAFAPLIVGSKASGTGFRAGDGGGATGQTMKRSDFDALPPDKQGAIARTTQIID